MLCCKKKILPSGKKIVTESTADSAMVPRNPFLKNIDSFQLNKEKEKF